MSTALKVTMTVETTVDEDWRTWVTGGEKGYTDVFLRNSYCGYWLEGIDHDPKLGWLAFEFGAVDRSATEAEKEEAIAAWLEKKPLPPLFHALNDEVAEKSWCKAIERWGKDWYDDADGPRYDCALQTALFGEAKYG